MIHTVETIKFRFIEAAEIECRMKGPRGPSGPRTAWPVHRRERAEVAGYFAMEDDPELQDPVTAAEQTRHSEVVAWMRQHIANDGDRRLIWAWAASAATNAFQEMCRERRIDPASTMVRVERVFAGLAAKITAAERLPRQRLRCA